MKFDKNISRASRDKRADTQMVHDQSWSFIGPYRVFKKDLVFFEILSNNLHINKHIFVIPYCTLAQDTKRYPSIDLVRLI